jgi:hypothetical protein
MNQLDARPTFKFTRLSETKDICKSDVLPAPVVTTTSRILIDKEDLDLVAQQLFEDQHRWRDIADINLKTILEWGIDFPFTREIQLP